MTKKTNLVSFEVKCKECESKHVKMWVSVGQNEACGSLECMECGAEDIVDEHGDVI